MAQMNLSEMTVHMMNNKRVYRSLSMRTSALDLRVTHHADGSVEDMCEQHLEPEKLVDILVKLLLKFDELKADFGILRDRVAMLDGGFADDEDVFWRDLYKKGYQNDDYEAFVAVRGPHLAKMDIIERAGMMKQFEKVVEDLTSRD